MDYTTVDAVKLRIGAKESTDDALLAELVTAASRKADTHCAGQFASDYFAAAAMGSEVLRNAAVDVYGRLICWPHKPIITSIAALQYRLSPRQPWQDVDLDLVETDGPHVLAWLELERQPLTVQISYVGGYDTLPDTLVHAVNILAARYYREMQGGYTDSIGVADLGNLIYTKAVPLEVVDLLKPLVRTVPW